MLDHRICAYCQYYRSAIMELEVIPEHDWGLCVIRSSQTANLFSSEKSRSQRDCVKLEENQVEGTSTCKYWTKNVNVSI